MQCLLLLEKTCKLISAWVWSEVDVFDMLPNTPECVAIIRHQSSRFPGEFISSVNKRKISHLHQRSCALHDLRKHAGMSANSSEWISMRKNNSLNIWILNNPNFWGSRLIRYGVVMSWRGFRLRIFVFES